jgi:hypothetical protein
VFIQNETAHNMYTIQKKLGLYTGELYDSVSMCKIRHNKKLILCSDIPTKVLPCFITLLLAPLCKSFTVSFYPVLRLQLCLFAVLKHDTEYGHTMWWPRGHTLYKIITCSSINTLSPPDNSKWWVKPRHSTSTNVEISNH